jgi:hypothetical protein
MNFLSSLTKNIIPLTLIKVMDIQQITTKLTNTSKLTFQLLEVNVYN